MIMTIVVGDINVSLTFVTMKQGVTFEWCKLQKRFFWGVLSWSYILLTQLLETLPDFGTKVVTFLEIRSLGEVCLFQGNF